MTRIITLAAAIVAAATVAATAQGLPGAHFIENWDLDGNGEVTLAELETRRGDVFFTFDANEDGMLDAEEYVSFDEARASDMTGNAPPGGGGGMRRASEGMSLGFNDMNGDGAVDTEEFLGRTAAWMAMIDRDGSGAITATDFGRR